MTRRSTVGLVLLTLAALAGGPEAQADAWCKTRNHCTWISKKYTANAYVSCIGLPIPLCYSHSGSCGQATADCSWRNCLWGGGSASASNSSAGCSLKKSRTGLGIAGNYIPTPARDDDFGDASVDGTILFDDDTRSVSVQFDRASLVALTDGLAERLDVYAFVEDVREGAINEDDPVRTDANTLWHGSVALKDGILTFEGLDSRAFSVTTDAAGLAHATAGANGLTLPFEISAEDFANLVVEVSLAEAKVSEASPR